MTGRTTELACVVHCATFDDRTLDLVARNRPPRYPGLAGLVPLAMLAFILADLVAIPLASAAPIPGDKPNGFATQAATLTPAASSPRTAQVALRLRTLNRLLARTGLDLNRLVAQADPARGRLSEGEGGPLVPAIGRGAGRAAERASAADFDRLRRMESVLLAVPIAAPMDQYKLNSGFGYRSDPFRHRGAMHTGLDFGGERNAPIKATAPGKVVEAGRDGAYGVMVVIDHGLGIETRYAHLSRALVRVGDQVPLGRIVGVMGRTGRATGAHLHYEIRVDGRPVNPRPFLEAGIQLAGR